MVALAARIDCGTASLQALSRCYTIVILVVVAAGLAPLPVAAQSTGTITSSASQAFDGDGAGFVVAQLNLERMFKAQRRRERSSTRTRRRSDEGGDEVIARVVPPPPVRPPSRRAALGQPLQERDRGPTAREVVTVPPVTLADGKATLADGKAPADSSTVALAPPVPPAARGAPKPPTPPIPPTSADGAQAAESPLPKDRWDDGAVIAALRTCMVEIGPHDVDVVPLEPMRNDACGTPAPVRVSRIGSVSFKPAVTLNCAMVGRLARWIADDLQPAARQSFETNVIEVRGANGYACRNRYGAADAKLSEHALANAIDIPSFLLANGRSISVLDSWGLKARALRQSVALEKARSERAADRELTKSPVSTASSRGGEARSQGIDGRVAPQPDPVLPVPHPRRSSDDRMHIRNGAPAASGVAGEAPGRVVRVAAPPTTAELDATRFLKILHETACRRFGTVLGPEANEAHEDHFHLDLAERRRSAYCR